MTRVMGWSELAYSWMECGEGRGSEATRWRLWRGVLCCGLGVCDLGQVLKLLCRECYVLWVLWKPMTSHPVTTHQATHDAQDCRPSCS